MLCQLWFVNQNLGKIGKIFRSFLARRISPILLEERAFACKMIENLAIMGFSAR